MFQFNFENTLSPSVDNVIGTPEFTDSGVSSQNYATGTACLDTYMYVSQAWNTGDYYQIVVNTTGFKDLVFSYCNRTSNVGIGDFKVRVSLNGTNWTDVMNAYTPTTNNATKTTSTFPVAFEDASLVIYTDI